MHSLLFKCQGNASKDPLYVLDSNMSKSDSGWGANNTSKENVFAIINVVNINRKYFFLFMKSKQSFFAHFVFRKEVYQNLIALRNPGLETNNFK